MNVSQGKPKSLSNDASVTLWPQYIAHDWTRGRTRVVAVGSRRWTALAMARKQWVTDRGGVCFQWSTNIIHIGKSKGIPVSAPEGL
jgi:hypothetical protein